MFEDPPFGVAEWVAFSPMRDRHLSAGGVRYSLVEHFEEDLQLTWDSWSELLKQVGPSAQAGLHPALVPPRSCWLAEPAFDAHASALGFD